MPDIAGLGPPRVQGNFHVRAVLFGGFENNKGYQGRVARENGEIDPVIGQRSSQWSGFSVADREITELHRVIVVHFGCIFYQPKLVSRRVSRINHLFP